MPTHLAWPQAVASVTRPGDRPTPENDRRKCHDALIPENRGIGSPYARKTCTIQNLCPRNLDEGRVPSGSGAKFQTRPAQKRTVGPLGASRAACEERETVRFDSRPCKNCEGKTRIGGSKILVATRKYLESAVHQHDITNSNLYRYETRYRSSAARRKPQPTDDPPGRPPRVSHRTQTGCDASQRAATAPLSHSQGPTYTVRRDAPIPTCALRRRCALHRFQPALRNGPSRLASADPHLITR